MRLLRQKGRKALLAALIMAALIFMLRSGSLDAYDGSSETAVSNEISGVTFMCDIIYTGMDAWWPDAQNGLIRLDQCWEYFLCSDIPELMPGDVVLWKDDTEGGWTNHIAVVTEVEDDGGAFITADGNQYTDTGISLNRHAGLNKSNSTSGIVCVWRNTESGQKIAEHAKALTEKVISEGYDLFRYKWGEDGWCYCYACEILITAGDDPEDILSEGYMPGNVTESFEESFEEGFEEGSADPVRSYTDTHSGLPGNPAARVRRKVYVYYPDGSRYDIGAYVDKTDNEVRYTGNPDTGARDTEVRDAGVRDTEDQDTKGQDTDGRNTGGPDTDS